MREKVKAVGELFDEHYKMVQFSVNKNNPLMSQLSGIDRILDEMPEVLKLAHENLRGKSFEGCKGRPPEATAEQVLRSAILMQLRGLPYRELANEIDVNSVYRKFTRFYAQKIPHFTVLNRMIKMIRPETMERINEVVVKFAKKKKVEKGKAIRYDTTVSETNIGWPVDAKLLNDSVRVLSRTIERLRKAAPEVKMDYQNHTRRCKKRTYQIVMVKGKDANEKRKVWYKDLLKMQTVVRGYAEEALRALESSPQLGLSLKVMTLAIQLEQALRLSQQVYDQAYRRVIRGESLPADEKLLSFFETHTDIICRGKKESKVEFGHKIEFGTGCSGIVTYYNVLKGNPGDNEGLVPAVVDHIRVFGCPPEKVGTDRRYHSRDNEEKLKALGVSQVALPKSGYLNILREKFQKASWFKKLMRWRAGIEGNLSTLLRSFGLKRCLWKGWNSFKSYIGLGVLSYNLRILAGHLTGA